LSSLDYEILLSIPDYYNNYGLVANKLFNNIEGINNPLVFEDLFIIGKEILGTEDITYQIPKEGYLNYTGSDWVVSDISTDIDVLLDTSNYVNYTDNLLATYTDTEIQHTSNYVDYTHLKIQDTSNYVDYTSNLLSIDTNLQIQNTSNVISNYLTSVLYNTLAHPYTSIITPPIQCYPPNRIITSQNYSMENQGFCNGLYITSYSSMTVGNEPYNIFNNSVEGIWGTCNYVNEVYTGTQNVVSGYNGDWIKITVPKPLILSSFQLKKSINTPNYPSDFKIYGSKDGINWVELTSRENLTMGDFFTGAIVPIPTVPYITFVFVVNKLRLSSSDTLIVNYLDLFGRELRPTEKGYLGYHELNGWNIKDIETDTSNYVLQTSNLLITNDTSRLNYEFLKEPIGDGEILVNIQEPIIIQDTNIQEPTSNPSVAKTPINRTEYKYMNFIYTTDFNNTVYTINFPENTECEILIVSEGGAGGVDSGGGGGTGGVLHIGNIMLKGDYIVSVGRGGLSTTSSFSHTSVTSQNGRNSFFGKYGNSGELDVVEVLGGRYSGNSDSSESVNVQGDDDCFYYYKK